MSETSPATPPSTNTGTGNLKVLATKNQLLQQIDDTVAGFVKKLEYSSLNRDYRSLSDQKIAITEAFTALKNEVSTKEGLFAKKSNEVTEESLTKDIKKGKISKEEGVKKLEEIQKKKQDIEAAQAEVNRLEGELRTLKQEIQPLLETQEKNAKIITDLEQKINKAKEEWERKKEEVKRKIIVIQKQEGTLPREELTKKLEEATKEKNRINAESIEYESLSTKNLADTKAKYPDPPNLATKQEELTTKEKDLAVAKLELENTKKGLKTNPEDITELKRKFAQEKADAAAKRRKEKEDAAAKRRTDKADAKRETAAETAIRRAKADAINTRERTKPVFNFDKEELISPSPSSPIDTTSERYKKNILAYANADLEKMNQKVFSRQRRIGQNGQRGGATTLAELLKTYKTKVYLDSKDIEELKTAFSTFIKNFNDKYTEIAGNITDPTKKSTFQLLWKLNGLNKSFPTLSSSTNEALVNDSKKYIADLFTSYNNALVAEEKAIKEANPAFTEQQIKEELEKRVRGVLPAKDLKALGGPSEAGPGKGEAGSGSGIGSSDEGEDGTTSSSPMGSALGKGLMDGFNILYTIFGALGAVLVLGTFFLSTIDILKFSVLEVWQYVMLFINPNMFNKDTLDFSTLLYAKNSEKDEPYTIFLQQEFISFMFKLVTYFVNTVILQIGIFMVLKVLKSLGKVEFEEGLDFGPAKKAIGVMVITIASAFIQNTYYNTTFLNSLQPEMVASTSNIRDMADAMYNNMTNNSDFLNNLTQENLSECIRIINTQGERTASVGSMIFTLSLYNFFKINIPSESSSFSIIRDVFTLQERKVRSINPTSYMYFQQNVFIPNLYAMIEPYISGSNNVLNTKKKRDDVRKDVALRISRMNQLLMGLFVVPSRRSSFRNYIYFGWILALAFVVGIYSIYREEIDQIYDSFVKPFLSALNEFFWNIVMPWDIRSKKEEAPK